MIKISARWTEKLVINSFCLILFYYDTPIIKSLDVRPITCFAKLFVVHLLLEAGTFRMLQINGVQLKMCFRCTEINASQWRL